jgi:hypothetical protein
VTDREHALNGTSASAASLRVAADGARLGWSAGAAAVPGASSTLASRLKPWLGELST